MLRACAVAVESVVDEPLRFSAASVSAYAHNPLSATAQTAGLGVACAAAYRVSLKQRIHRHDLLSHGFLLLIYDTSQLLIILTRIVLRSVLPVTNRLSAAAQALRSK